MLDLSAARSPSYRWGAGALFFAAAAIVIALGFEHIGGYTPCPLCLQQRWAYYAGVPALFMALLAYSMDKPHLARALFVLVAVAFLANAGLAVYHAGAEWKYWPGPETCSGTSTVTTDAGNLLQKLERSRVIRCDEAAIRIAGLSFAGWNVIASLMLSTACVAAAMRLNFR